MLKSHAITIGILYMAYIKIMEISDLYSYKLKYKQNVIWLPGQYWLVFLFQSKVFNKY